MRWHAHSISHNWLCQLAFHTIGFVNVLRTQIQDERKYKIVSHTPLSFPPFSRAPPGLPLSSLRHTLHVPPLADALAGCPCWMSLIDTMRDTAQDEQIQSQSVTPIDKYIVLL